MTKKRDRPKYTAIQELLLAVAPFVQRIEKVNDRAKCEPPRMSIWGVYKETSSNALLGVRVEWEHCAVLAAAFHAARQTPSGLNLAKKIAEGCELGDVLDTVIKDGS